MPPPQDSLTKHLFRETWSRWLAAPVARMAAALSYYTLFSLAPLILLSVSVAGLVFGREAAQGHIVYQMTGIIGAPSAEAIQNLLKGAYHPSKGVVATIVSLFTLLIGAFGVLSELKGALNHIWHIPEPKGIRAFLRQNLRYLGMILAIGFLLLVSLIASAALNAFGRWIGQTFPFTESVMYFVGFLVSFSVTMTLFAVMYKVLPDTWISWGDVWIGAGVTSLLFSIGKIALGFYLAKSAIASTYGAAGSVLIILVWVYYSGFIFYLGAEFTKVYAEAYGSRLDEKHKRDTTTNRRPPLIQSPS